MTKIARLYIDVDETIIACCNSPRVAYDLRPGVMTQLMVLSRLFDCQWLTCWDDKPIFTLMRGLYGGRMNRDFGYANWALGHPLRKAGHVLDPKQPQDFWWLEDPLCSEEIEALRETGKLDRYIRVEPSGYWGFLDAVNELFRRVGVSEAQIRRVGGHPEWFTREYVGRGGVTEPDRVLETLYDVKLMLSTDEEPEVVLERIRTHVQNQMDILQAFTPEQSAAESTIQG